MFLTGAEVLSHAFAHNQWHLWKKGKCLILFCLQISIVLDIVDFARGV